MYGGTQYPVRPDEGRGVREQAGQGPAVVIQPPPLTLTVRQMMRELNISEQTAYRLIRRADFPKLSIGTRILIPYAGLSDWLNAHLRQQISLTPKQGAREEEPT